MRIPSNKGRKILILVALLLVGMFLLNRCLPLRPEPGSSVEGDVRRPVPRNVHPA